MVACPGSGGRHPWVHTSMGRHEETRIRGPRVMSSVRRSLAALLILGSVLIALVGLVGSISALQSARALDHMVDDIRPAAVASRGMHEETLAAGAAIRAFALSSDQEELDRYHDSVRTFQEQNAELDAFAGTDPAVERLRATAVRAFDAWVTQYAEPRIASGGGEG
ncbi:MAG: hypothetical protein EOO74_08510, partial [Myxococcales bacterium]